MKTKLILIGIAVLFLASAVVTVNIQAKKIKAQKAEIARIQENNAQLMGENLQKTTLVLRKDEINSELSKKLDSVSKALEIKPKQVLKIITETITQIDSIPYPVIVDNAGQNFWKIKDAGDCFIWQGDACKDSRMGW
jgi:hypothetical protein